MIDGAGYCHRDYAHSLAEFGRPRELPRCGGWILERQIPGTDLKDAMGCYPLFTCRNWSSLDVDLSEIGPEIVSLTLVVDPFGTYTIADLHRSFHLVKPFKKHFVAHMDRAPEDFVSKHHRKYSLRAMSDVSVELCAEPSGLLSEWEQFYRYLCERHSITGIRAFSARAFERQFKVPGTTVFRATSQGLTVGLDWWYVDSDVAHGHLAACNPLGYGLRASYALKWSLLHYFHGRVGWVDLGGVPGLQHTESDGLAIFKRGWATETKWSYFCGRVFDRAKYNDLASEKGVSTEEYFPAYRMNEFL